MSLWRLPDPYLRGVALIELWEAMLEGQVAPGRLLDNLLVALKHEPDELNVQQMLGDVRVAFWRYTPADARSTIAPRLEQVLRAGLTAAASTREKAAWFNAFRSTVLSAKGVAWLERVWRRDEKIPGLPLSETDEANIAADLAVRGVADADAILQTQLARFTNADRRARFAFIIPALSPHQTARDAFVASLQNPANRAHEAWVVDALGYVHHPLRAATSRKYLPQALAMLPEIQRTGDIFFPKNWADAVLSGYQSRQAAADVRAFIDQLPASYPTRLRWILLSSADPLFRAATLLRQ